MSTETTDGIRHHRRETCAAVACPFHRPSEHALSGAPMVLRSSGLIERTCPHGIGHPDPDSAAWLAGRGVTAGVHGCDGCCRGPRWWLTGTTPQRPRSAEPLLSLGAQQ